MVGEVKIVQKFRCAVVMSFTNSGLKKLNKKVMVHPLENGVLSAKAYRIGKWQQ